jgi:hypothetical protein
MNKVVSYYRTEKKLKEKKNIKIEEKKKVEEILNFNNLSNDERNYILSFLNVDQILKKILILNKVLN